MSVIIEYVIKKKFGDVRFEDCFLQRLIFRLALVTRWKNRLWLDFLKTKFSGLIPFTAIYLYFYA